MVFVVTVLFKDPLCQIPPVLFELDVLADKFICLPNAFEADFYFDGVKVT